MLRCVCGKAFVTTVGYETHVATQECHTKAEQDRIDAERYRTLKANWEGSDSPAIMIREWARSFDWNFDAAVDALRVPNV